MKLTILLTLSIMTSVIATRSTLKRNIAALLEKEITEMEMEMEKSKRETITSVAIAKRETCKGTRCFNGGKCVVINSDDMYGTCICASGFAGSMCASIKETTPSVAVANQGNCKEWSCQNGGTCSAVQNPNSWKPSCDCAAGFKGTFCTDTTTSRQIAKRKVVTLLRKLLKIAN